MTGPWAFVEEGRGEPAVVLVHGLLGSSATWSAQRDALASARRVVCVELPGHGGSAPPDGDVTVEGLAGGLVSLLRALGIARAVLGGVSLGGNLALRVALQAPELVVGLVIASTDPRAESEDRRARQRATLEHLDRLGPRALVRGLAAVMFGATTRAWRPELVDAWIDAALALPIGALQPLLLAASERDDLRPLLPSVRCPARIFVGEEDRLVPHPVAAEAAALLPAASLHVVPATGHSIPLERPEVLTAAVEGVVAAARDPQPIAP